MNRHVHFKGSIIQYFQRESFLLPLVKHHSYKNEQHAIQGYNTPSRKCTAYSWRIQPVFVQYSLQPIISLERGSKCAEHAINLSNMRLYFTFSQRYRTQFTAESRVVFKMHYLLKKKLVQDTAVVSGSAFLKFQLCFHAQNVLFPCKCVTFFQQGSAFKAKYRWCLEKV